MAVIVISGYQCERCKHEWVPRTKTRKPVVCPKCHTPYWDRPKQSVKEEDKNA